MGALRAALCSGEEVTCVRVRECWRKEYDLLA